ncbi:MAG: family 20 glycosylhydrolase [Candidatus Eremiobacteraeota bacterium]|nr:family 20 glycosylhydrolase [Candidatus Eremiobacteraeota bacterium]
MSAVAPAPPPVAAESFAPSVVPRPKELSPREGTYEWPATMRVVAAGREAKAGAGALERFARGAGIAVTETAERGHADVVLETARSSDTALGSEGYILKVRANGISLAANGAAGFNHAAQTLAQLTARAPSGRLQTHALEVRDWPAFGWRGIHLDVSRHYFPLETLKRYVDLAERYKLNVFHMHLTDDEGWRIEIKRRPLLTEVGSCTPDRRSCAYYTQTQIRELVAYARERNVEIVPEIDVPGHSGAATRSYPDLACEGGGDPSVLCPTEQTFAFLDDVLTEVVQLFPGPYVHVGGDEVSRRSWRSSAEVARLMRRNKWASYDALQAYFTQRLAGSLARQQRRAVVWDDALSGTVPPNTVIMAWRGEPAARLGLARGFDVVAVPDGPLYFDGYQGDPEQEPSAMRFRATLEQVYRYRPVARSPAGGHGIVGMQANVWTEQIATPDHLFYMLLPRELALAETAWAGSDAAEWLGFQRRLPAQLQWLSANGYRFRIPDVAFTFSGGAVRFAPQGTSVQSARAYTSASSLRLALDAPVAGEIRFTTDGTLPTARAQKYAAPVALRLAPGEAVVVQAAAFVDGRRGPIGRCTVRRTATLPPPNQTYSSWTALISDQRPGIYVPPRFP